MGFENYSVASLVTVVAGLHGAPHLIPLLINVYELAGIDTNMRLADFPPELKQRIAAAEPLLVEVGTKLDELITALKGE
jgi:hypothetical protein